MELNPSYATSVQADNAGDWQHTIPSGLPPGLHHVVIQDEQGNEQTMLLFVDRPTSSTGTVQALPQQGHNQESLILALLGLIIILSLSLFVSMLKRKSK